MSLKDGTVCECEGKPKKEKKKLILTLGWPNSKFERCTCTKLRTISISFLLWAFNVCELWWSFKAEVSLLTVFQMFLIFIFFSNSKNKTISLFLSFPGIFWGTKVKIRNPWLQWNRLKTIKISVFFKFCLNTKKDKFHNLKNLIVPAISALNTEFGSWIQD
jgi:hypothetical protein